MTNSHRNLPLSWEQALDRMYAARQSKVYMPASIVIALDMIARGEASADCVPYDTFAQYFRSVMRHVAPVKADRGWQPFFHLTGRSMVWSLQQGANPSCFDDLPRNEVRSDQQLRDRADRASFAGELAAGVYDPQVRLAIRNAILQRLRHDDDDEARRLVEWIAGSRDRDEDGTFEDFAIDNLRREVEQRQKQSKFRKLVLANFNHRCCLSGIEEPDLLVASHIVPWSEDREIRLDPANGLCLSVLYDKLFDKGYLTFTDELQVVITPQPAVSDALRSILEEVAGRYAAKPVNTPINPEYLARHRKRFGC